MIYRVTRTSPNGQASVFLVEQSVWERFEAWRKAMDERLAKKEQRDG